jgi:hypothetical protein
MSRIVVDIAFGVFPVALLAGAGFFLEWRSLKPIDIRRPEGLDAVKWFAEVSDSIQAPHKTEKSVFASLPWAIPTASFQVQHAAGRGK